ncbi:MAG: DUF4926 domain-containing protein [Rhodospirillales bacterium]|nr:MAG: DUF4926 domain-containing protein [Rhodospirillales bacterium]TVR95511.1 MAG: DUF4926 domain-containing protein [Rhodospirillales bacterium]
MTIGILDTVVLAKDLPQHGLKQGDVGAVVMLYHPDGLEVEFVTGDGHTQALLTLHITDVRPVGPRDILAVRTLDAA